MRIRLLLVVAAALTAVACSNPTEPSLVCEGNPKCEANPVPNVPSPIQPLTEAPTEVPAATCRIRITVRCE